MVPVKSSRNFLGYPFSTYCKHSAITITITIIDPLYYQLVYDVNIAVILHPS